MKIKQISNEFYIKNFTKEIKLLIKTMVFGLGISTIVFCYVIKEFFRLRT